MSAQQMPLPIPSITDWMTRGAVAVRLRVDPATVSRWAAAGVLTQYTPLTAPTESRPKPLFYAAEVEQLAEARSKLGGRRARAA